MNGDRAKEFEVHCTDEFTLKLSPLVLPIHFFVSSKYFSPNSFKNIFPKMGLPMWDMTEERSRVGAEGQVSRTGIRGANDLVQEVRKT